MDASGDLKLIPGNQNRNGGDWSPDDFDVILIDSGENGRPIFKQNRSGNRNEWFWGLAFDYVNRPGGKAYGHAESKDAAEQAFANRWRFAKTPAD